MLGEDADPGVYFPVKHLVSWVRIWVEASPRQRVDFREAWLAAKDELAAIPRRRQWARVRAPPPPPP